MCQSKVMEQFKLFSLSSGKYASAPTGIFAALWRLKHFKIQLHCFAFCD